MLRTKYEGFTLIELLVVIAIITVLAAILFPVFTAARDSSKLASCASNERQLGTAILLYADSCGGHLPPYDWGSGNKRMMWFDFINPYLKTGMIYKCPALGNLNVTFTAGANNRIYGYGVNAPHLFRSEDTWPTPRIDALPRRISVMLLCDAYTYPMNGSTVVHREVGFPVVYCRVTNDTGLAQYPAHDWTGAYPMMPQDGNISGRHHGMVSVLYVDGHVKACKKEYITQRYSSRANSNNGDIWGHFDLPEKTQ